MTGCMFCESTIFPGCCDGSGSWKGTYKSLLRVLSLAAAVLNKAGTNQPKSKLPIDGVIKIMIKYVPNERKTVCL